MRILFLLVLSIGILYSCEADTDFEPTPELEDSLKITYFIPDSVEVSTSIRIGGQGFGTLVDQLSATINGVAISIESLNDTVLVVTAPATPVRGKLAITVAGKTVTSLSDIIVYEKITEAWIQKTDFAGSQSTTGPEYYKSFTINGKGFYLKKGQLWVYDPATDKWTQKATPPTNVNGYGFCFTIGEKAFVGLGALTPGQDITNFKEVWEYNATTNLWSRKNDFPGWARVVPFSFSIGTNGYIGAGDSTNSSFPSTSDIWKYESATDTWVDLGYFPAHIHGALGSSLSGVSVGNFGYVIEIGQNNPTAPLSNIKSIDTWKYDPSNNSWQKMAILPTGDNAYPGGGSAFVIGNNIYLGIGSTDSLEINGQKFRNNFWMYNTTNNTWTEKQDIGGGLRLFGTGFAIGEKGYFGLGTTFSSTGIRKDFWEYTP